MPTDTAAPDAIQAPGQTPTEPTLTGPWIVILYNDDWHSFDQVILQLQKATGCAIKTAVLITLTAHHAGRAVAYEGSFEECERAAAVLREIRLQAETDRNH